MTVRFSTEIKINVKFFEKIFVEQTAQIINKLPSAIGILNTNTMIITKTKKNNPNQTGKERKQFLKLFDPKGFIKHQDPFFVFYLKLNLFKLPIKL